MSTVVDIIALLSFSLNCELLNLACLDDSEVDSSEEGGGGEAVDEDEAGSEDDGAGDEEDDDSMGDEDFSLSDSGDDEKYHKPPTQLEVRLHNQS